MTPVALLVLMAGRPAHANLIVNGSFEAPDIPQNTFLVFSSIPGWSIVGTAQAEIQDRRAGNLLVPPYDGNQQLELDGFTNASLVQTVSIPADGLYSLSLAYSARPQFPASTNTVEVLWDNVLLAVYSESGVGLIQLDWGVKHILIDTFAGDHALMLRGAGTSDTVGGIVDAVSLDAVPEPGTWMLAGIGLVLVALPRIARRFRD
jgi:hypothetical protein